MSITGVWGSVSAHLTANTLTDLDKSSLILVSSEKEAKQWVEDLATLELPAYYYPPREMVFFDSYAHSHQDSDDRMRVIDRLIQGEKTIIVTTAEALLVKLPPRKLWNGMFTTIEVGEVLDLDGFKQSLANMGYEHSDMVDAKGHMSIRGGIIDIWPPALEQPIRIELWDDEVDSIRLFDPSTQVSIEKISEFRFGPCRELIVNDEVKGHFITELVKRTEKKISEDLKTKLESMIEQVKETAVVDGMERYFDLLYGSASSLIDFLPKDSLLAISDPTRTHERADRFIRDYRERFKTYFERGALLPEQLKNIFEYDVILDQLGSFQVVLLDNLSKRIRDFNPEQIVHFQTMEAPLFHGKNNMLAAELKEWKRKGYRVILSVTGKEKTKRLQQSLRDLDVESQIATKQMTKGVAPGQVVITEGNLHSGWIYRALKYAVLTDKELSGTHKKPRKRRQGSRLIKSFNELNVGDYVVHEGHGVGKYVGIDQLSVDGMKRDYMKIRYSGDDSLYIPVEQMDLIQKYIGNEDGQPKLNRLGGQEWKRAKAKAKKTIEDMTDELLALYAIRESRRGHAYSVDGEWQQQFEAMFPYEETPDQLKCISEIKKDMENPRPMERLLCGDVGYGKTEVAIRAIFKAVMDSKQVALLVPTTILAQQHYNRLVERFSKFPVRVEMMSRFRSAKQQEQIAERMRTGTVDVVVGTHRLLSKDLDYKDLGLLVIDEEQRFGVKHKEKIKKLKETLDVLTLTATPIPRTLHMSLVGIRDMSVIEDPPEDRYPIQTYVIEMDENLIAEAIDREIDRGGQVFFVHNRVSDIDSITARLQRLLPDARIQFAHGQMSEVKLEKLMMSFMNHEFDVLVCTTIIETGLDISNVNTIIVNDADKMGLSQLYQLRGRVGRSNRVAYAYLTYQRDKVLSEIAEKRLKAIKEFTELGSGFKIAMRDLEIRGAGTMLGSAQSGHLASIGYELYSKMLEEQVRTIKGEEIPAPVETTIEFAANAYIPDDYVGNKQQKLDLYKRISSIRHREDAMNLEEEIEDRYGTLRASVYNLIRISLIKAYAMQLRFSVVKEDKKAVRLEFQDFAGVKPEWLASCSERFGRRVNLDLGKKPHFLYKFPNKPMAQDQKLIELAQVMEAMAGFQIN